MHLCTARQVWRSPEHGKGPGSGKGSGGRGCPRGRLKYEQEFTKQSEGGAGCTWQRAGSSKAGNENSQVSVQRKRGSWLG